MRVINVLMTEHAGNIVLDTCPHGCAFAARYGTPTLAVSDNTHQFKIVGSTLTVAWKNIVTATDVILFFSKNEIVWKFVIAFSPWMGGFYEKLVGLVKRSMRKTIGCSLLDYNQLFTICYLKFMPWSTHDHFYTSRAESRMFSLPTPSSPSQILLCCL